jgi:glycosyltransferase involved in cell wall biosynthesis
VTTRQVEVGLPVFPSKPDSRVLRIASRMPRIVMREMVARHARRVAPDVVYSSQQRFDIQLGAFLSRRLRVPHVVHLHFTPGPVLRTDAMRRLRSCDRVIAVSAFVASLAEDWGVDRGRVVVIPNSIEDSMSAPAQPLPHFGCVGGFRVGQVGRMDPGKGFADTIRAFAQLYECRPSAQLVLIGDGSERPALEQLVHDLGLVGAVQFTGWQHDARGWLSTLDVFLHPSRREPFGLAALEASAAGLPVVAYDEGGLSEIVVDGQTGLLVRPGDIDALAQALIRLSADHVLRARMGRAGRARAVVSFSPRRAGRALSDAFRTTSSVVR